MMPVILLILSGICFWIAWTTFCVVRGAEKAKRIQPSIKLPVEYLYDWGNPFSSYDGPSNW